MQHAQKMAFGMMPDWLNDALRACFAYVKRADVQVSGAPAGGNGAQTGSQRGKTTQPTRATRGVSQAGAAGEQYGAKRMSIDIGKHKGFILQPAKPRADGTRPWVWYAPTSGSHPTKSNAVTHSSAAPIGT